MSDATWQQISRPAKARELGSEGGSSMFFFLGGWGAWRWGVYPNTKSKNAGMKKHDFPCAAYGSQCLMPLSVQDSGRMVLGFLTQALPGSGCLLEPRMPEVLPSPKPKLEGPHPRPASCRSQAEVAPILLECWLPDVEG